MELGIAGCDDVVSPLVGRYLEVNSGNPWD